MSPAAPSQRRARARCRTTARRSVSAACFRRADDRPPGAPIIDRASLGDHEVERRRVEVIVPDHLVHGMLWDRVGSWRAVCNRFRVEGHLPQLRRP